MTRWCGRVVKSLFFDLSGKKTVSFINTNVVNLISGLSRGIFISPCSEGIGGSEAKLSYNGSDILGAGSRTLACNVR